MADIAEDQKAQNTASAERSRFEFLSMSDNERYSRIKSAFKIGLPLAIAILIVLIVVLPRLQSEERGFTLSFDDAREQDGAIEMINPRFVGTDSAGRPYSVSAANAVQSGRSQQLLTLENIDADIILSSGTFITMAADSGELDRDRQILVLAGPVQLFTDLGYEFTVRSLRVDLEAGRAQSDVGIEGQGPAGEMTANALQVERNGDWIRFHGGIRATVYPAALLEEG